MDEQWRRVPGHPDYEASNLGRVRSFKRGKVTVLNGSPDAAGYMRVVLDGKRYLTHRLIAAIFIGPCPDGKETDHINEVRHDNRAVNLRYLTRQENMARMTAKIALTTECSEGHPMTGPNLYVRPSNGRRECRACTIHRVKNRPSSGIVCSEADCTRIADCRLRTSHPVCEMHYQRLRTAAKRQQLARAERTIWPTGCRNG